MITAVIPARGGSKGIPRKNLRTIHGKPLLTWSIQAALQSEQIDRVVVSSEDQEILDLAKKEGSETLIRPPELASDEATTISVLKHVIEQRPEITILVLLQPTSPLRHNRLVDRCIRKFLESGADTLATGYVCKNYEWGTDENTPRQKLTGWFYDDGNVYVHKTPHLRQGKWWGAGREPMIVEKEHNFEINDEVDFMIVEALMKKFYAS